jgi:hypothetical protein
MHSIRRVVEDGDDRVGRALYTLVISRNKIEVRTTDMQLGFVDPILAPRRDEGFLPRHGGIKDGLKRMAEYASYFILGGFERRDDRRVGEERHDGRHDELVQRNERLQGSECVDRRRVQRKPDFLIRLAILQRPVRLVAGGETSRRTAVCMRSVSDSSALPPGSAVCPAWVRKALERVVKRTRSSPTSSYRSTRTAASLELGNAELSRKC